MVPLPRKNGEQNVTLEVIVTLFVGMIGAAVAYGGFFALTNHRLATLEREQAETREERARMNGQLTEIAIAVAVLTESAKIQKQNAETMQDLLLRLDERP